MTTSMKRSVRQYLKGITSVLFRRRIRALFAVMFKEKASGGIQTPWKGFNDVKRHVLTEAIFAIEDAREIHHGPRDQLVVQMRAARNDLYDDLGWNEKRI